MLATLIVAGPVGAAGEAAADVGEVAEEEEEEEGEEEELVAGDGVVVPPHAVITTRAAPLMATVIGRTLLMVNPDR